MSRPLRLEFANAIYHVTSRGDRREPIFDDDEDRRCLLDLVAEAMARYDAALWAYCLMDNHYHFVVQTRLPNLSLLMRHINGVYTQRHNRRHGKVGHLFQGRFKSILVDRQAYLLEVCRYVELNPIRARLVDHAGDWPWSSYRAHVGSAMSVPWLASTQLHEQLLARPSTTVDDRMLAQRLYAEHVLAGLGQDLWADGLRQQIYLGDTGFVARMQAKAESAKLTDPQVPRAHRTSPLTMSDWLGQEQHDRRRAARRAHRDGGLTLTHIARELGVSLPTVSRWVNRKGRSEADPAPP